jgi:hypothetical protein
MSAKSLFKIENETTLVNVKYTNDFDVLIARPSKWGNPWSHKKYAFAKHVKNREIALQKYKEYLLQNKELMDDIESLRGKKLGCYCINSSEVKVGDPYVCHGQIIIEILNQKVSNE